MTTSPHRHAPSNTPDSDGAVRFTNDRRPRRRRARNRLVLLIALFGLTGASSSRIPAFGDELLDFNELGHGEIVNGQYSDLGISVSAHNPNRSHDLAIGFDSGLSGTRDPDLERGSAWSRGNLANADPLGTMLILSENDQDSNGDGILDNADDEGRRPGGSLILDFAQRAVSVGFDLIDIEVDKGDYAVEAFREGSSVDNVDFAEFTDASSQWFDPTIEFGDRSANRVAPILLGGEEGFDRLVFHLGGSGAIDNLRFQSVPGPASLALLGVGGLCAMTNRRRREPFRREA